MMEICFDIFQAGNRQFSPASPMQRNMSPQGTPTPRRPLHLMSNSHNGIFTRMTNENGQSIDIYENPSEHYAGINSRGSPFLGFKNNHHSMERNLEFNGGEGVYTEHLARVGEVEDMTDEDELNDSSQKPMIITTPGNNAKDWRGTNYSGSSSLSSFSYSPRSNNSSVSSHGRKIRNNNSRQASAQNSLSGDKNSSVDSMLQ